MQIPEQVLRRLEFTVVRRLDGFLFGDYTGVFYGPSLDLAEIRPYQPGDEVNRIDWSATARTGVLHVRQYREEKELTAWLVVDLSPSMSFGTRGRLKRTLALEFTAVAAYIIARHGDKVGAYFFPERRLVPPRPGRRQVLAVLRAAQELGAAGRMGPTDLAGVLDELARVVRRRSLIFLVSDFLADGWAAPLQRLAHRHDVIAVRVMDPAERALPDAGVVFFEDPETGRQVRVNTSDPRVRRAYAAFVQAHEARLEALFRAAGVDTLTLLTHEALVAPLLRFVAFRRRRRWRSSGR
ncbi:DUF58 domain-containing protein [Marinithermus hydrothermalis]|uniref:DUF58 domain-containing protein n=1 Tax=Marinithermus hydrothermalis (strain DSM 14884 / JCM 11576 / T1) TaxID=869210 RepID=F2NPK6_MARHT|nr:DUF58 domain-containing protein [Marinithermus hydrothermalis]AEB12507.1 protein of unknown function DUF58 [Marinithermus hydrothermalis DSM 14884]